MRVCVRGCLDECEGKCVGECVGECEGEGVDKGRVLAVPAHQLGSMTLARSPFILELFMVIWECHAKVRDTDGGLTLMSTR